MYEVCLADVMFPIAPSKIELKIKNKNKTAVLIDEGEINFLRTQGLTDIKFEVLIPSVKYPFAQYTDGFKPSLYYLNHIKNLKINKKPFMFKVVRRWADGKNLSFGYEMKVSLEDYTIKDDASDGFDIRVSLTLKQYRDYGTKIGTVTFSPGHTKTYTYTEPSKSDAEESTQVINDIKEERQTDNSPDKKLKNLSYYTTKGVTTWELSMKFYGNMANAILIEEANKRFVENGIINAHLIPPNTAVVIPEINSGDFWQYKDEQIIIDTSSIIDGEQARFSGNGGGGGLAW